MSQVYINGKWENVMHIKEFADKVGIPKYRLQNYDNNGKFKAKRDPFSNFRYYTEDDVDKFFKMFESSAMMGVTRTDE